jgi:hypothetical protein
MPAHHGDPDVRPLTRGVECREERAEPNGKKKVQHSRRAKEMRCLDTLVIILLVLILLAVTGHLHL